MLLERAAGLADKITRYEQLKSAATEAERFRTRAEQVRQAASLIAQARAALSNFTSAGIVVDFAPMNADALIEKANVLLKIASENPAGLIDPPFNIRYDFVDRVSAIASAANKALVEAWERHVEANGPGGSDEVLDALARLPPLRAGVGRIRRLGDEISALAANTPSDPRAAVTRLANLVAEHRAAWADLTADGIPRAIIVFLRSCGSVSGAPLSLLTEEVRDWLASRNLLDAFRIRIG